MKRGPFGQNPERINEQFGWLTVLEREALELWEMRLFTPES
jgi:hypothetical protein